MKKSSQGRLPRDNDDDGDGGGGGGGLRLGLGGFCLRHCAISSQWLNRSFASSTFSPPLFLPFLPLLRAFLARPFTVLSFHRVSFNAVFSLSLVVPGGDAVLGLSPVTYAPELPFRSVTLSRFISMPRYFCIFLSVVLTNASLLCDSSFDTREKVREWK